MKCASDSVEIDAIDMLKSMTTSKAPYILQQYFKGARANR